MSVEDIFANAIDLEGISKDQWKNIVGKGYRSVCYMTNYDKSGRIILFGFDLQGNRQTYICPWESHVSYNVMFPTESKDIYGRNVNIKYFKSKYERDNYVKNADSLNIVECLKPEQEFLHFMFDDCVLDADFNKQKMRIFYLDIETEISESFMRPVEAGNRINMITIYDNFTDKYYTWSLLHAEIDFKEEPLNSYPESKFKFFEFNDDEEKMLEHFLSWYEDNYPDVMYGWNTRGYDIPYIVRRIENVLGKNAAKRLSPIGRYFIKEVNHDNKRADVSAEIEVEIQGLFNADGLVLYRDKFNIAGGSLDGGFSLDNVGEHEGCGHKIHYEGTLKDLYIQNYQKFYEYNVRDVDLCKRIDDKCNMIKLARQITTYGLTNYGAIYSSISYLIGSVLSFAKTQMGNKIFTSYLKTKHDFKDGFEGAFVFPTIPGVYKGGIGTIDFASLYPSSIRAINASPETFVGKILIYRKNSLGSISCNKTTDARLDPFSNDKSTIVYNENNEIDSNDTVYRAGDENIVKLTLKQPNGKEKIITIEQLRALINTKCIWTANNTLFLKHEVKDGIIAKWCEYFYSLRKKTKKEMLKCFHTLHDKNLKLSDEEIYKLETDEENYNTAQLGIKAMINSIYGCMGTSFSPIANPDIAQSVTRTGRFCNISTSKFIKKKFEEKYNAPKDYVTIISGDTDSIIGTTKLRIRTKD